MKRLMKKYGGVIFFYTAIIVMIWVINWRFSYLATNNGEATSYSYLKTIEN